MIILVGIYYWRSSNREICENSKVKGALMQIWKPPYMFVFKWNKYPENFAFLILRIVELYTGKVWEMFIYKYAETIEHAKINLLFKKNTNFTGE